LIWAAISPNISPKSSKSHEPWTTKKNWTLGNARTCHRDGQTAAEMISFYRAPRDWRIALRWLSCCGSSVKSCGPWWCLGGKKRHAVAPWEPLTSMTTMGYSGDNGENWGNMGI
jgi:hypothetical protein